MASGKRARDSDRESVVGVLHDALVDGQLDPAEHERRVEVALASAYVDDLRPLLDDLQVETPASLAVPGPAPSPKRPTAARDDAASRRATWGALAVIVATAVIGGAVWLGVRGGDDDTPHTSGAPAAVGEVDEEVVAEQQSQAIRWEDAELLPEQADDAEFVDPSLGEWTFTKSNLQAVLGVVEERLGRYYTALTVRDGYLSITRPVAATSPTTETWMYGEEPGKGYSWTKAEVRADTTRVLDLEDLDVDRLFANMERAENGLGLPGAVVTWVDVSVGIIDLVPELDIWVEDPATNNVAWLTTTVAGSIVSENPYRS